MIIEEFSWQYALLLSNALMLCAVGFAASRMRREMQATREFWQSPAAAAMQAESYDDRDLRRMVDRRMTMLEKFLEQLIESKAGLGAESTINRPLQKHDVPVDHAVRMARSGASLDDLVRGCGLNKGEAQLLMRLHACSKTAPPSGSAATH